MSKVVCFGEIMLRLSPPGYLRFVQANSFDAFYGGGEANVSVSLANFGVHVAYVTKVPDNPIGQSAINELRRFGVDTGFVVKGGERLGIYFLEMGASQRPSQVVYDRKYSAISQARAMDFDWPRIFEGAGWFHFTGITPALGDNLATITLDACKTAKEKGLTVSCDLNYRTNLWPPEKAGEIMKSYMPYVDILITNQEHAGIVFGLKAADSLISNNQPNMNGYQTMALELQKRFGFRQVAITFRTSISAFDNHWSAFLFDGKEFFGSRNYPIHMVDRVGSGDSFTAGLIYAMLNNYPSQDTIEFASATACLKHSITGDFNHATVKEVKDLISGDGSGRIKR
jgi:2-dehydro-3-deoxygluconokinase